MATPVYRRGKSVLYRFFLPIRLEKRDLWFWVVFVVVVVVVCLFVLRGGPLDHYRAQKVGSYSHMGAGALGSKRGVI